MQSNKYIKTVRHGAWIIAAGTLLLSGCQNASGINGFAPSTNAGKPIDLSAGRRKARVDGPVGGAGLGSVGGGVQNSALMPVNQAKLRRAIERYRINKRVKQTGPVQIAGVDLDSNGLADGIVLLTGKDWCAKTGCTLAVFTPGARGFTPVSTIRRVKPPILVAPESHNGWRDIIVRTGLPGAEQTVALQFGGQGYPGNAAVLASIPRQLAITGEVLIGRNNNLPGPARASLIGAPPQMALSNRLTPKSKP